MRCADQDRLLALVSTTSGLDLGPRNVKLNGYIKYEMRNIHISCNDCFIMFIFTTCINQVMIRRGRENAANF